MPRAICGVIKYRLFSDRDEIAVQRAHNYGESIHLSGSFVLLRALFKVPLQQNLNVTVHFHGLNLLPMFSVCYISLRINNLSLEVRRLCDVRPSWTPSSTVHNSCSFTPDLNLSNLFCGCRFWIDRLIEFWILNWTDHYKLQVRLLIIVIPHSFIVKSLFFHTEVRGSVRRGYKFR